MKRYRKLLYTVAVLAMLPLLQACFQDLEQNPPFNYPEEPPKPPINEEGQILYFSFNNSTTDAVSKKDAAKTGNPAFAPGKDEQAYAGATDSYLTFKLSDLASSLGSQLTIGFWYKVNASPDRAGIITISPITEGAPSGAQNNRTSGLRIFREGSATKQTIKGNVGNGTADSWLDGGDKASLNAENPVWKYIALTITEGKARLYIDAEEVAATDISKISWAGTDIISIGSGAPRFTEWGHLSDRSLIDELRFYNKALSPAQIKDIINHDTEQ